MLLKETPTWAWLGIVLILLGVFSLSLSQTSNFIPGFFVSLGAIFFATGTAEMLIVYTTSKNIETNVESSIEKNLQKPLKEFYQERGESPHIAERIEGAEALWCIWHTGSRVTIENIARKTEDNAELRLILIDPDSDALKEFADITESDATFKSLREDVRRKTKVAQEEGFEVRWLPHLPINSINIVNPNREGAVAQLEIFFPFDSPENRPNIIVSPKSGSVVYDQLKEIYEGHFWDKSEPPPEGELT